MPFEESFLFCGGILIVSLLNNTIESSATSSLFVFAILHPHTQHIIFLICVPQQLCPSSESTISRCLRWLFWEQPLKMVHNIYNYCGKGWIHLNFKRSANVEEPFLRKGIYMNIERGLPFRKRKVNSFSGCITLCNRVTIS